MKICICYSGDHTIVPPPPDVQPIIDKMASYVAKNGPDFEMIVKAKTDERFQFLHHGHVHNLYYEYKKHLYEKEFATEKVKVTITQTSQNALGDTVVTKTTTTLANVQPSKGVSFSIKAKESEGPTLSGRKMALLYDSSDDEDGGNVDILGDLKDSWRFSLFSVESGTFRGAPFGEIICGTFLGNIWGSSRFFLLCIVPYILSKMFLQ